MISSSGPMARIPIRLRAVRLMLSLAQAGGFGPSFNLSTLNGTNGFRH